VIVDSGILIALLDRTDKHHGAARATIALPEPRLVPEPVLVEADWFVLNRLGVDAEIAFLRGMTDEAFTIVNPRHEDRDRATELISRYRDLHLGYVDAVLVAIAERLREPRIASLDRRDLLAIKPRHVEAFELLP